HRRAPGATSDHHAVCQNGASVCLYTSYTTAGSIQAGDAGEGLHLYATPPRAFRVPPKKRPGKDHSVLGIPGSRDELRSVELRHDFARLARRDHPRRQAVLLLQLRAVLDAPQRLVVVGEEKIAALAQPDIDAQLLREMTHEVDRFLGQLDQRRRGPLRADAAAVASGSALAEIAALEHQDALPALRGEVPCQRQTHDAAADDRHVGALRQPLARLQWMGPAAPGRPKARLRGALAGDRLGQAGVVGERRRYK